MARSSEDSTYEEVAPGTEAKCKRFAVRSLVWRTQEAMEFLHGLDRVRGDNPDRGFTAYERHRPEQATPSSRTHDPPKKLAELAKWAYCTSTTL